MSKIVLVLMLIVFVLLDLAALNDILQGIEPTLYQEWLMLLLSVPIIWIIVKRLKGR